MAAKVTKTVTKTINKPAAKTASKTKMVKKAPSTTSLKGKATNKTKIVSTKTASKMPAKPSRKASTRSK